jgi:hypothetical protein
VVQLAGIDLRRNSHCLTPWMASHGGQVVPGLEHSGVEWISVQHLGSYGNRLLRLVHNARCIHLKPCEGFDAIAKLRMLQINDGDFILHAMPCGITVPPTGIYFPPGSLQIVVDQDERNVINDSTTLPIPRLVPSVPYNGWCKKQHIYVDYGMTEKAVIFFNDFGWPIACRENEFISQERVAVRWWRFDYSRPAQELL